MSSRWRKDSKTGELYQDRIVRGKPVRVYRDDPRESTSIGEESSSRRDLPPSRHRRDSIVGGGSVESKTPKYETHYGTSSKRERSTRRDDHGKGFEHTEATHVTDSRGPGEKDEPRSAYTESGINPSSREGKRPYHPAGGYNTQQPSAANSRDEADELGRGLQSLSLATDNRMQPIGSSLPAPDTLYDTPEYGSQGETHTGYGRAPSPRQPAGPSKESISGSRTVKGTPHLGDTEKLDKSYQIRNRDYRKFFKIGRVFATLWTEGVGNNINDKDQTFVSEVVYKERVHSKIRRFVVVREGDRSVLCLPVTSYGGYGHKKRDIRLEEHGFIYSKNSPQRVPDGMLSKSLKVILSRGAAQVKDLTDPSLVNYAKVYTVETNVKVKDVGDLDADSKALLMRYFRRVLLSGDSDLPSGIEDTPRQSNAMLAYVGGAADNFPSPNQYNTPATAAGYFPAAPFVQSTGQDVHRAYTSNTYGSSSQNMYAIAQDAHLPRHDSGYHANNWPATSSEMRIPGSESQAHPGPLNSTANMGSGFSTYQSPQSYGSIGNRGAAYNTTPAYYSPDSTHPSSDSRYGNFPPVSISQYGPVAYSSEHTPRTPISYSSEQVTSGDAYIQPGAASGGSDYRRDHQISTNPSPYYVPAIDDRDDEIRLTTVEEEERRRRNSNAGMSRDRKRRR